MSSVTPALPENWWVSPDLPDVVDSFSGVELHPLSAEVVVMPFEKYGLWWFLQLDGAFAYQATHGPYVDEETALIAGGRLIN